jgi:hypothetical protein
MREGWMRLGPTYSHMTGRGLAVAAPSIRRVSSARRDGITTRRVGRRSAADRDGPTRTVPCRCDCRASCNLVLWGNFGQASRGLRGDAHYRSRAALPLLRGSASVLELRRGRCPRSLRSDASSNRQHSTTAGSRGRATSLGNCGLRHFGDPCGCFKPMGVSCAPAHQST